MEAHRDCLNVAILENIIKDVKKSDIFNEIAQLINEMNGMIAKVRQNRETNSSVVRKQKIIVENEILDMRTQINNHRDKLQEDLMKELTETEKQITDETRCLLVSLDEKQKELVEYQTDLVNIKTIASDLQTFVAVKQIEKDIETHDTYLKSLVNSNSLCQIKLECKIYTCLKTITTAIQRFGEVVVESKPCELVFVRIKDKQAQMMVTDLSPPMSVENIQLNLKQKLNIKGRNIRGCSLLPDGRMVLSCRGTNTISFINKEGVELFQIGQDQIGSGTYDTVYIKENNNLAVSSGNIGVNRCITIIDIESQEIITTISMNTYIFGTAVRGRTIYFCTGNAGLKMLNISDKSLSEIINSCVSYIFCMAISGDQLYYTNCASHTVTCCDLHGTTQWEFNDEHVLVDPRGITVDNNGNVYVVGCSSNNVMVFSPVGQRHRQVLSSGDGLVQPRALEYDKSTNKLLVVNESESAFLFEVTRIE
jgi:hypothetical protein